MPKNRPPSRAPTYKANWSPGTSNFQPSDPRTNNLAPGLDIPIDTGYDVEVVSKSQPNDKDWTIMLENSIGQQISLWVEEVETSFKLQGSSAQARHYRQFYPAAFSQPILTVRGRMPNQYEYNRLAQFVRISHVLALDAADINYALYAAGGQPPINRTDSAGDVLSTVRLYLMPSSLAQDKNIPRYFRHDGMILEGHIMSIQAGATKFEYAPEYTFDFNVADSTRSGDVGIYTDTLVTGSQIMTELAYNDITAQQLISRAAQRTAADNASQSNSKAAQTWGHAWEQSWGAVLKRWGF